MSSSVFPVLPGIVYSNVKRRPSYHTTILKAWSGKEVRLGRQALAIVSLSLQVNFARTAVSAPDESGSGGQNWSAYSEYGVIKAFHDTMKGSLDTFHVRDPDGGADIVVRFASDDLDMGGVVAGVWQGRIDLVTVI